MITSQLTTHFIEKKINSDMQNVPHNNSCKIYFLVDDAKVYFNADFDSGNVQKIQQISPYIFKIFPGFDKLRNGTNKTFFHFKVYGLKMCKANFIITRMNIIQKLIKNNQKDEHFPLYFPVFRRPDQDFQKVELEVQKYYNSFDQPEVSFSFEFDNDQFVQFAFSYPYSYEDCQKLIEGFSSKFNNHESIYFHQQVICYTQEKRKVHLITITEKQNCQQNNKEQRVQDLFPQQKDRCLKVNKPVILISARVHPGQSPASYAIEGALKFLLNQQDFRSYLLRKNFVIKIIPMLNPDGVFYGMFRSDLNGQNLNRVYVECNKNLHPTIWSFRKYCQWLNKTKNILFFFDFHAHPSTKNFFIYGNSFHEISYQTEVQFFGKLIEANCPYFQNFESIFSEKQMKIKHKNDNYSKEGCARVFMRNLFEIIHSYTVECGYFGWTKLSHNQEKQSNLNLNQQHFIEDNQFETIPERSYNPQCYMLMGKSILITILDLFNLNPYPKKVKGHIWSHIELRKSIGTKIYHQNQIFKLMDASSYKKLNQLSSLIQETYYSSKLKGTKLKLSTNPSNNLLIEQINYVNLSPKAKQKIKTVKNIKTKSLSKPKPSAIKSQKSIKKSFSLSKVQNFSQKESMIKKEQKKLLSKPTFPDLIDNKLKISSSKNSQQYLNITAKAKDIKFLYNDLERFNQEDTERQIFIPYYSSSEKKVRTQNENPSPKRSLQKLKTKDVSHFRLPSFQEYNNNLQEKSSLPSTRQSKIRSNVQQSLIERSLILRKGSVNKVVFLKKDDIKLLRISNLIEKKIQRQAIHGPIKNISSKKCPSQNLKECLPVVNGIRKT